MFFYEEIVCINPVISRINVGVWKGSIKHTASDRQSMKYGTVLKSLVDDDHSVAN